MADGFTQNESYYLEDHVFYLYPDACLTEGAEILWIMVLSMEDFRISATISGI